MGRALLRRAKPPTGTVTAMFTDMVNSTQLKGLVPGQSAKERDSSYRQEIKQPHDKLIQNAAKGFRGYFKDSVGDAFCYLFADAEDAVRCALEIQKELGSTPIATPLGNLQVRIGLHSGSMDLAADASGATALDKAARVQGWAEAGQVLLSLATHGLVASTLTAIEFISAGAFNLKGLGGEELFLASYKSEKATAADAISPSDSGKWVAALNNPYNFSASATGKTFKGRQSELDELVAKVEGGTHTAIFGLQRMGKTSLIQEGLRERLQQEPKLAKSILLAEIDLMDLGGDEVTYKDLFSAIIDKIVEQLSALSSVPASDNVRGLTHELWAGSRYTRGDRTVFFATVVKVLRGIAESRPPPHRAFHRRILGGSKGY